MIRFDLHTHIYRQLVQVFTFVATPENDFQWQYGTLASAQVSGGEIGVGTRFRAVGHVMGWRLETLYEVTVFDRNERYGFESVSGPVHSRTLYTFAITGGGTGIDLSIETNPGGQFKPVDAAEVRRFKKQYKENLAMLKSVLEVSQIVKI